MFQGQSQPEGFCLQETHTHTRTHTRSTARLCELQAGSRWRGQRHTAPLSQHALGSQKQGEPPTGHTHAHTKTHTYNVTNTSGFHKSTNYFQLLSFPGSSFHPSCTPLFSPSPFFLQAVYYSRRERRHEILAVCVCVCVCPCVCVCLRVWKKKQLRGLNPGLPN